MADRTPQDIARIYAAALQSVELLRHGEPIGYVGDWSAVEQANKTHLALVLGYDCWTTEDLTPLQQAASAEAPRSVQDVERPSFDAITHSAREMPPVQVDGVWTQQWEVFALPPDVVATNIAATIPAAVTMRQARLALLGAGQLAAVEAAIDAMSEPTRSAARIEWEYSGEVQRHNGFVAALGPALGLSSAQIDALFVAAAAL